MLKFISYENNNISCVFLRPLWCCSRLTLFNFGSLLPCLVCSFGRCCAVITCALCVYVLSVLSGSLLLHAALLTFSLHLISFAVASVLRTFSFAVCLPGWGFLYLWCFVSSCSFCFLLSFGLWRRSGLRLYF